MDLIRASIERPIAVVSTVLMVILFGYVALLSIPIQLAPDVNQPVITVTTEWPGAAPAEVEREITNRQEDELRGLEGLRSMTSQSEIGRARVELEFLIGTDMDKALLLVANRLDRVGDYPAEAEEPILDTAGSDDNAIAWMVLMPGPGNERRIGTYYDFAEDVIKDRIERVPGIARMNIYGGSEREMQVIVDPERLARFQITVPQVVSALRQANASISGGAVEEGKRRYTVRTEGDLESPGAVRDVVLRSDTDPVTGRVARVTVGDVAEVTFDYKEAVSNIRRFGTPAIGMPMYRETGANVIETMQGVRDAIAELQRDYLPAQNLILQQVYDETTYIDSAIELVTSNIYIGGALAALVLFTFLRSWQATLVVSLAIPVSVIGSFVAMAALGRSINVISLAGIAFAVGMVVDAAIVVLENIFRLRQTGHSARDAAYRGAAQVWGAVLVSALTTVMVFLPILIMELEVGQLFRDIAVAISVSVLLSLLVSVTVIPALAGRLLGKNPNSMGTLRIPLIDSGARAFKAGALALTRQAIHHKPVAIGLIVGLTAVTSAVTWAMLPKIDYLPNGNRNLVIGWVQPPAGYNLGTMTAIAGRIEDATRDLWATDGDQSPTTADGRPKIAQFFFAAFRANAIIGAAAVDPARAADLIDPMRNAAFSEPGTLGFFRQTSLFGRGIGGARAIDLDIAGGSLEQIVEVAGRAARKVATAMPRDQGTQMRPRPGLTLGAPEVRVVPDRLRLADNGVTAVELGQTVDAFNDGLRVAEITVAGERIDLTLRGPFKQITETQGIRDLPVVTASGTIVPVGSLAGVFETAGPTEIRHRERARTITLQISPPAAMPLEQAMDILRAEVIEPLRAEGLPPGTKLLMSGTADKLTETWNHMVLDLALALVIVYLVMAVLFESFFYPLIIVFSVPLATAGGVIGLWLLNRLYQQNLDMLTLLGFVILIGTVVNNAILLVDQTLYHLRKEGLTPAEAILEATGNRIRPIFMSTLTSVLGMMPLVLMPGAGSELYRGLGSVVVGGLSLSAVLTLGLIPPMLSLFMAAIEGRAARDKAKPAAGPVAEGKAPAE
ncbi:multidrug transporter AcrB [Thalassobaculum fulvum]|uniref:Multidrug transporter AcrB n=1 Tax=Thalassobaculum fulvum TaxID=1633335 RepID=A0A918XTB4_9PROT|nr:efflux RND transporter permease subunit [Thalassobaculum fulvum]GHD51652.1 multidrug transporter AcrB [Thalassobaculum fulvum]